MIIFLGGIVDIGGLFIASFVKSPAGFFLLYCLIFGNGNGVSYFVPLMCAWEHNPKSRGLVSGIIFAGFGFGTFIFSFVTTALVNPNNVETIVDPESGVTSFLGKLLSMSHQC